MNAIIIHGMSSREEYFNPEISSPSKSHWLPWLKEKLESNSVKTEVPEMPEPYDPDYKTWSGVFEELEVNENTILIGHSCGGGFLVRWLSEHSVKVRKLILVAPWIDPHEHLAPRMFKNFSVTDISDKTDSIHLFISLNDDRDIVDTAEILKKEIRNLHVKEFTDKGHFIEEDMGTTEFFALLKAIL